VKITVLLEASELRAIARVASEAGMVASTWIRQAAVARLRGTSGGTTP